MSTTTSADTLRTQLASVDETLRRALLDGSMAKNLGQYIEQIVRNLDLFPPARTDHLALTIL